MNAVRDIWIVTMLFAAGAATADFVTKMEAVETSASTIVMPGSINGMITYKHCKIVCSDNDYKRARLTPETRFSVRGKAVKFEDFRREFDAIRQSEDSYALVGVDTKSRTVTSIDIAN